MEKNREYLPEEVIVEILLRLPVKSVLRCKCVCKSWFSLISDPNFATSHFQLALSPTHKLVIFRDYNPFRAYEPEALTIDFNASLDDDSAYHSLTLNFLPHRSDPEIIGSCRGFLLLDVYPYFYLWNPSTGVNKQIPLSPITIAGNDADSDYTIQFLSGLAYEPSTDDYLVVLGSYECDDVYDRISSSLDLEIFSLRANNWKQIQVASHLPYECITHSENGLTRVGLFLNGAIHWLVYNYETKSDVIIAFDLKEMTMSEITLPNDFDIWYLSPLDFDVLLLNGLISVWVSNDVTVKIWVMQEYKVHSSWTYSMHPAPQDNHFSLISFTNCGDIVGIDDHERGLKKFNNKGQLLEHHSYHVSFSERSQMAVYTESMLSLPSGTDEA